MRKGKEPPMGYKGIRWGPDLEHVEVCEVTGVAKDA